MKVLLNRRPCPPQSRHIVPAFIHVSEAKSCQHNLLVPEPGAFYVIPRVLLDFSACSYFIAWARSSSCAPSQYQIPAPVLRRRGQRALRPNHRADRPQEPQALSSAAAPMGITMRSDRRLDFLTNHFAVPAATGVIDGRWNCFSNGSCAFLLRHLGTVKTQLWNAVSVYVLVAIVKKRLNPPNSKILQILSLTLFEKIPLIHLLTKTEYIPNNQHSLNQLNLFE